MTKYIDSKKLITEIKRFSTTEYGDNTSGDDIANGALDYVLEEIIPSLQQEQTDTNEVDGKFVKILIRKEYAEQIQRLGDAIHAGQSSFIGTMNQQEQQEVDLEKEIDSEWKKCLPIDEGMGVEVANIHIEAFDIIARHFYELGLNARKEE